MPLASSVPLLSADILTETFLILVVTILVGLAIWSLTLRLEPGFGAENVEAIRALLLLAVTSGATVYVVVRWKATDEAISAVSIVELGASAAVRFLLTFVLFVAAYTLTRILKRVLLGDGTGKWRFPSGHLRRVTFYASQVVVYVGALLVTLVFWEIDLGGLLLGAGVLGIVLGFAAQETIGSILAGFILLLSRPFDLGDWVRIGDHEGFVSEITINNVTLRNLDGEHVVIPNTTVHKETIVNRSVEGKHRVRLLVGVDYEVDPGHAERVALAAIEALEEVTPQPPSNVIPVQFDDSAIVLELRFWIDDPTPQRRWRARRSVIHAVKDAFDREGIKIPFPQRELSGREETGGFHVVEGESSEPSAADTMAPPSPVDRDE